MPPELCRGGKALIMQGRYSHAQQMKRSARQTGKLKTHLGRVMRDIGRKTLCRDGELTVTCTR